MDDAPPGSFRLKHPKYLKYLKYLTKTCNSLRT